uniref:hypothetical protein n=1 Tax=uncultured Polaribacter sp. TaxID=174711 RepID=UPI00261A3E4D
DINTEETPGADIVPLRIVPNTVTPTGANAGEFYVADDGLLYGYDATRSKWLSVSRNIIGWGANNGNSNIYLRQFNGTLSNLNGWRMIRNGTITTIRVQGGSNQTYTIEIRKNDVTTAIASLDVTSAQGNHDTTINVDFEEGDYLQCYVNVTNGSRITYPQALIQIAWRK